MKPASASAPAARPTPETGFAAQTAPVIAVDVMGGDAGPPAIVEAVLEVAGGTRNAEFLLFGDGPALRGLVASRDRTGAQLHIRPCADAVAMDDSPRQAIRRGPDTSMRRALAAVAQGDADAIVSAGNTAALATLARLALSRSDGVATPAIAALWPTAPADGALGDEQPYAVVLDMGANLEADADALVQFAAMGVAYARLALLTPRPRIALLNVGAEPSKGRPDIKEAARRLAASAPRLDARFVGFIEGDQIPSGRADVIVTDGFTGNIALKTAEGTARLIGQLIRENFSHSLGARLAALAARPVLRRLKRRMDPRRVNGGVFLGLDGVVVKSHGGADAVAFGSALSLALRLARSQAPRRIKAQVAQLDAATVDQNVTAVMSGGVDAAPGRDAV